MIHKLEADGIELSFGTRKLLNDVYLKCETGKITGLLGRNGQGKTCLMNILYGNLKAQGRSVRFDDNSVLDSFKRPDLLTYLPQFNFVPTSFRLNRVFDDYQLPFADFTAIFPEFLTKEKFKIRQVSGGQRRLIEVYLIIKSKAQFSLLDEPFSHVMPLHVEQLKALILSAKQDKGFLITDHFYKSVLEISDNVYLLKDGKTYRDVTTDDIAWLGYAKNL
jgi:ABC-type lipopolysaccharide export system ATPase subunit